MAATLARGTGKVGEGRMGKVEEGKEERKSRYPY
jgi:hypothetical protein